MAWLVCRQCGVKERVQDSTKFTHCVTCHEPRYGEDDAGREVIFWSAPQDPDTWMQTTIYERNK